jgi:flagellar protein FliJ
MTKFKFRLASVLRLRQTARDDRRVQLAESQRSDAELQGQLRRLEAEQELLQGECRAAVGPGPVDLGRLIDAQRYAAELRSREGDVREQRELLAAEIESRRQAVIEADRDVRTLQKLRDNQLQTHREEEQRQDAKRLDEAAMQTIGGRIQNAQRSGTSW